VLEVTATVEPFENGRGFSLRVLRAGKPRLKTAASHVVETASDRVPDPAQIHPYMVKAG
jgi:hypothetical protein